MPESQQCPADHPLMIAWKAYEATDEFKNTLHWATKNIVITTAETAPEANRVNPEEVRHQRAMGSLWAAFMAGFNAGQRHDDPKKDPGRAPDPFVDAAERAALGLP